MNFLFTGEQLELRAAVRDFLAGKSDETAVRRTLQSGQTHFYSRSRRAAWHKGGTSGHVQHVH